jgi:hypothetical protein
LGGSNINDVRVRRMNIDSGDTPADRVSPRVIWKNEGLRLPIRDRKGPVRSGGIALEFFPAHAGRAATSFCRRRGASDPGAQPVRKQKQLHPLRDEAASDVRF